MPDKETLWFKHDFDAHDDDKIVQMISKYKYQGYGWYWVLVEKMRGAADYKLPLTAMDAYAMRMLCGRTKASEYITDCIEIYKLFASDGKYFWSERLMRDMEKKNFRSEMARNAALAKHAKRYGANAQRTHSERPAIREDKSRGEESREEKKNDSPIGESTPLPPKGGKGKPKKPKPPKKTAQQVLDEWDTPYVDVKEALAEFMAYRSEAREPMSGIAMTKAINRLMELSRGNGRLAHAIVDQSIVARWTGLFPLKGGGDSGGGGSAAMGGLREI